MDTRLKEIKENLTINDVVRMFYELGFEVNMSFKKKSGIRKNGWALYLRHKRTGKK